MAVVASQKSLGSAGFTQNDDNPPHWFNPERFMEPNFDADTYVADLRRYVPLEALSAELQAHLQVLRNKLVEVINEHYGDFVSLSSKLVNVDSAVIRMQKPLLEIKEKLLAVRGEVTAALDALKEGLERRQSVASAKALLELMQDTAHVMSKVEKLLAEIQVMEGHSSGKASAMKQGRLDARVRMFERLASEVARLNFYAVRGKELQFVEQLEPRMGAAAQKLQALLSEGLAEALREGNASARAHCLQAFSAVGDAVSAEQIVREVAVAPLVEGCISAVQTHANSGPTIGSSDRYAQVLERVADAVKEQVGPVLSDALNDQANVLTFNFLANSVLQEVDAQLSAAFPGAFSVGVPEKFVGNYRAAQHFLGRLEALCRDRRAISALRDSDAYASFQGRWKLSVYYGLRFQNIAGGLDAAVSAPALEPASAAPDLPNPLNLHLRPMLALHHGLTRCTAEDVWLQPLADKFTRLALQLLARFAAWLGDGMDARSVAAIGAAAAPTDADPALPSTMGGDTWAVGAKVDVLCTVRADADVLLQWVRTDFLDELLRLMPFLPPEASEGVRAALLEGASAVAAQAAALVRAVIEDLTETCSGVLKQLRGITATYRMTTRPAPTKASHYVAAILSALRTFLDGEAAGRLGPDARSEIAEGVIAGVTQRFATQARDLLESLRKTESSLKRLKKSRAGEAASDGPGALSDADKVNVQLFLDAQEYGTHIKRFGVEAAELPAYVELWNAVVPPDRKDAVQS
ncbi:Conserved oligomeric Golgi complex subunit 2 [Coccomyxa sp. Obi]|nr:Conserved oligomeric Golgi complex subunit 2 [Coccomyxa sp. Obi]